MNEPKMDKWLCDHITWAAAKEGLMLHWKKLVSILVVAALAMVVTGLCVSTPSTEKNQPTSLCETHGNSNNDIPDSCPWHLVMSDLTHRLRLLEMAFKEQVIAREVIAAEVTNQSYTNLELEKKLDEFVSAIRHLSLKLDGIKEQMTELSSRLYSDECLGFLVVVFVVVQIILALRTKIRDKQGQEIKAYSNQAHNGSSMNMPRSLSHDSISGLPMSPKQFSSIKQDACVIIFSNSTKEQHSILIDLMLMHVVDGIKCPVTQSHVIDSHESLKDCPRAKLYAVFLDSQGLSPDIEVDQNGSSQTGSDADIGLRHQDLNFKMASLRLLNLSSGVVILVLTKDPGSQQLANHSLCNTNLPLIQSYDVLQELATNGRLFTIWNEFSYNQLSHIRKIGRSVFCLKNK